MLFIPPHHPLASPCNPDSELNVCTPDYTGFGVNVDGEAGSITEFKNEGVNSRNRSTYLHDHRHTWDRHCVATVVDQGHQHAPLADHNISSVAAVDLGAPSCDSADRDVL